MSMNRWWVKKAVGATALIVVACVALGWVVMALWNWLMPSLFGLTLITFWQGLGLFVLGRLLFGGMRFFGGHHAAHRHEMHQRWKQMTPEERESFSRGLRRGCRWSSRDEAGTDDNRPDTRNFVTRP